MECIYFLTSKGLLMVYNIGKQNELKGWEYGLH